MNRLDAIVKLAREQIRDIEKEERDLQRAKDRLLKLLISFHADTNGAAPRSRIRSVSYGKDPEAMDMMRSLILDNAEQHGPRFHTRDAYKWCGNYRPAQVRSILVVMANQGDLTRLSRGSYQLAPTSHRIDWEAVEKAAVKAP